jgi:hypothetical protein
VRAAALAVLLALPVAAQDGAPSGPPAAAPGTADTHPVTAPSGAGAEITPESVRAVERALGWLAVHQQPDGSWKGDVGFKLNQDYDVTAKDQPHVGVTALAGLAFLAAGQLPERGAYGDVIDRATQFVLSSVTDTGFITGHDTRMYSHAFATLFLAEVYGMTDRQDVRERLQLAVDFIVDNQNEEGGWRYVPKAVESDMSVTVCQLNALRGARNVGIRVPRGTIDAARRYVARSYVRAEEAAPDDYAYFENYYRLGKGSFRYQALRQTRSSFALTAAGIAALHNAGEYGRELKAEGSTPGETLDLQASVDFLLDHVDLVSGRSPYTFHYFYWYGHYYATQALYEVGGQAWTSYYPRIRDEIVGGQLPDGSLPCRAGPGPAFSTAVAAIILSLPYGYLPIFQR